MYLEGVPARFPKELDYRRKAYCPDGVLAVFLHQREALLRRQDSHKHRVGGDPEISLSRLVA